MPGQSLSRKVRNPNLWSLPAKLRSFSRVGAEFLVTIMA